MKRLLLFLTLLTSVSLVQAQTGKPATNPPLTRPAAPVLKTTMDSISYILGESAGYNLSQQGFANLKLNMALYNRGLTDITGKKKPLLDDGLANSTINNFYAKLQQEKSKSVIVEGEQFLAKNKLRPEVKTTASGLQYEVLRQGTGERMTALDTFVCHYRGTLINGTEFDASYNRGQPLTMPANQVIQGWTEALQLMPIGSKYKIYIPYQLGYGTMGQGQIPGGAVLIFEMELLDAKKHKQQ